MSELDNILNKSLSDEPISEQAKSLASEAYTKLLLLARQKDQESSSNFFLNLLVSKPKFKIGVLAKCYQTALNEKEL